MSIVTLKRKTETKYNNMSVGAKGGFSLNGGYRNQGYVGQNVISRSLPKTPMDGNTMRGHGGCCGTYVVKPPIQSAVISQEDENVIKPSVLGTDGMIATKYRWMNRPAPFTSVKPDDTLNQNTQGEYIFALSRRTLQTLKKCNRAAPPKIARCCNGSSSVLGRIRVPGAVVKNPAVKNTWRSYDEYMQNWDAECADNDVFIHLSTTQNSCILGSA
jgi:hypothetical protein